MIIDETKISLETDPKDIPWIFRNRDLTIPATRELKKYLLLVIEEDPELLRFLHRTSQKYIAYGGANTYAFGKWMKKLIRDLDKTTFDGV